MKPVCFPSPYIVGPAITDPDLFFGRCSQLEQFFTMLCSDVPQSIRVLGLRRSGKTSFLHQVANRETIKGYLHKRADSIIVAYVDLQNNVGSLKQFFSVVLQAVKASSIFSLDALPCSCEDFDEFQRRLKTIFGGRERRGVVLLDEFESLRRFPCFDSTFFLNLRALSNSCPNFIFVTASFRDLHQLELQNAKEDQSSPFFNVFNPFPIVLGALEPAEVTDLVAKPAQRCSREMSSEDVRSIQSLAGGLPYLVQAVAHSWYVARENNFTGNIKDHVFHEVICAVGHELDSWWQRLNKNEKEVLCQIARSPDVAVGLADVRDQLCRFGLLARQDLDFKISGEVVSRWCNATIENTKSLSRICIDSPNKRTVLILTAVPCEYAAVRNHLSGLKYQDRLEAGYFQTRGGKRWRVWLSEIGPGCANAAQMTEQLLASVNPDVALFVGIAGGLKDVRIGDVVFATKAYNYEAGRVDTKFRPRPDIVKSSAKLIACAKEVARRRIWLNRISHPKPRKDPKVLLGPIASGDKKVVSMVTREYNLLRDHYNDAFILEMEGHGFLRAIEAHPAVSGGIIRGISDLLCKSTGTGERSKATAAKHASSFAFEMLANL